MVLCVRGGCYVFARDCGLVWGALYWCLVSCCGLHHVGQLCFLFKWSNGHCLGALLTGYVLYCPRSGERRPRMAGGLIVMPCEVLLQLLRCGSADRGEVCRTAVRVMRPRSGLPDCGLCC